MPRRLFPRIVGEDADNYLLTTTNYETCKEESVKWAPKHMVEHHLVPAWNILRSAAAQYLLPAQMQLYTPYLGVDRVELHCFQGALMMYIDINPPGVAMMREVRKVQKCEVWSIPPFVSGPRPRTREVLGATVTPPSLPTLAPALPSALASASSPTHRTAMANPYGTTPPRPVATPYYPPSVSPEKKLQGKLSPYHHPRPQHPDGKLECEKSSLSTTTGPSTTPSPPEELAYQTPTCGAWSPPGVPLTRPINLHCSEQTESGLDHDDGFYCDGIWHDNMELGFISCKVCTGTATLQAINEGHQDIIEHGAGLAVCTGCAEADLASEWGKVGCSCLEEKCNRCYLHAVEDMKVFFEAILPSTNYGELCCKCYRPVNGIVEASRSAERTFGRLRRGPKQAARQILFDLWSVDNGSIAASLQSAAVKPTPIRRGSPATCTATSSPSSRASSDNELL
ncbi:hypothetical protein CERZMDRAFT_85696 [Cercospora zeae-maydis SCOH1-5]|uniref:Uncharacterized protein n=1 Tax=Cercospora zeae-maydis SCOH1-5 TaxID=717836 RepID=A0A6A6FCH6_9PEZI|nr:hypothetical protein CERZMDRAFT_85696 [Cercospora zeae-maydis SCOH1-5]